MDVKFGFTKGKLEDLPLPAPGQRVTYHDEYQHNLSLRVSGRNKIFYVRRKINGVSERIQLGRFPDLSVEMARKKAASFLTEMATGNHPKQAARKLKAEPTIGQLHDLYMEGHARQRCVRFYDMQKDFERYVEDWRNRKFSQVTRSDVQKKVARVNQEHGPSAANHMIILMRASTNWNLRNETISGENPWTFAKMYKIQSRERFLRPEELVRFFAALKKMPDRTMRDYILISLYTGARRANVLAMRWDQIDMNLGIWRIPLTKNKESHVVPLTASAMAILIEREQTSESEWVFPGSKDPTKHVVEPKKHWAQLLKAAAIEDLRIHDLRRTLASWMAMGNQSLPIIAKALGHKTVAATQIYSRLMADPVRQAMESAQADMVTAVKAIEAKNKKGSRKAR
jgi:integrase